MSPTAPTAPAAARPNALARLDAIGFPTKRDEAWRYAPHRQLAELTFGPSLAVAADLVPDLADRAPSLDGPRVVIVNGVVDRELSSFAGPDGVHISTLAVAAGEHPELVAVHFEHDDVTDAYMALNLAYGGDGAVIRVDEGATVEVPIHVIDIAVPGSAANTSCSGVIIDLGARATATVVETRLGVGDEIGGSNVRSTISLGDDATLEHVVLQDLAARQTYLGDVEVVQGARSSVRLRSFNLGAAFGRLAYRVELVGAGAHVDLSGLFFGVGEQVLDQQIKVIHVAKDCTSRQSFCGVLDDASTGVFNGGIDVCAGADGTDAAQSNDNLVLSNRAEVNTQPRLEILADEVACKHGATVGQLDDRALYYMRTRGIPGDEARRLLINGFADRAVDEVGVEAVRAWITHRLGHDND